MISVVLYTKENCGLCDTVKQDLASLQPDYPHRLTEIDITQETAVFDAYKHIIPVVEIGNRRLQAPITHQELETALRQAAQTAN